MDDNPRHAEAEDARRDQQQDLPLNRNPLNQMCQKALREVGQQFDPQYLASLQLAVWVLEQGGKLGGPHKGEEEELLGELYALYDKDPERAQLLLLANDMEDKVSLEAEGYLEGQCQVVLEQVKDREDPLELGWALVLNFLENLEQLSTWWELPTTND
jgi:hypothetical protein